MENTLFENVEQDAEESNEIRREYREIREQMNENRMTITDPNNDLIEKHLLRVETNFQKVIKPREAVSDNKALLEIAILGKERIKNIHCEFRAFTNVDFMDKMKAFMLEFQTKNSKTSRRSRDEPDELDEDSGDDEQENKTIVRNRATGDMTSSKYVLSKSVLNGFGKCAMNYFRIAPRPTFLLGSLNKDLEMITKKFRQRRVPERRVEGKETMIKELTAEESESKDNSTVTEIERIFLTLKKYYNHFEAPFCFYQFVLHPKSFSRTIENIFYVSFLVKDGYIKMDLGEDKLPTLTPMVEHFDKTGMQQQQQAMKRKKNDVNFQSMVSMTKLEWKELVELFEIEKPVISDTKDKKQKHN